MVSVCLAAYNGATYIRLQIESILPQLTLGDELIVVDDYSTDDTVTVVESFDDPRIRLVRNTSNLGYVRTFEKALAMALGDVVFLSDQDDYWLPERVRVMSECLTREQALIAFSNFAVTREQGSLKARVEDSVLPPSSAASNVIGLFKGTMPYFGSAMCLDRTLLGVGLPFPRFVESHDTYLAILANVVGKVVHCQQVLTLRTLTGKNISNPNRSIVRKIRTRVYMVRAVAAALRIKFRGGIRRGS